MANGAFTGLVSLDPGFWLVAEEKTSQVGVVRVVPLVGAIGCLKAGKEEEEETERKPFHLKVFLCFSNWAVSVSVLLRTQKCVLRLS